MKTLDRYLAARMASTLIKTAVALVIIYIVIDLLASRRVDILKHDVPPAAVARYYLAYAPSVLFRVSGLATLITGLLVLGNMAQNGEITATLAGGIGLRRLVAAPVLIAFAFFVFLAVFRDTVGVAAAIEAERLDRSYFSLNPGHSRPGVSWANLEGGWTCHVLKYNRIAQTGETVLMRAAHGDTIEQIQARRIYWDDVRREWLIEDGRWRIIYPREGTFKLHKRFSQISAPIRETPDQLFALSQPPETKTARQLALEIRRARERGAPTRAQEVDLQAKFSEPAVSFVMIGLAIPFAIRLRRGGLAIGFGTSIVIGLIYVVIYSIAMAMGHTGRLEPIVAAWGANAVFMVAGLIMFYRTPT